MSEERNQERQSDRVKGGKASKRGRGKSVENVIKGKYQWVNARGHCSLGLMQFPWYDSRPRLIIIFT